MLLLLLLLLLSLRAASEKEEERARLRRACLSENRSSVALERLGLLLLFLELMGKPRRGRGTKD